MSNLEFLPANEDSYPKPTTITPNMVICPRCNSYNFITDKIKDCRFCGPDKDNYHALVKKLHIQNIEKGDKNRTPRAADGNICKICNRDHRQKTTRDAAV